MRWRMGAGGTPGLIGASAPIGVSGFGERVRDDDGPAAALLTARSDITGF